MIEGVRNFIQPLLNTMGEYIPQVFGAVIIFAIGFGLVKLITKGTGAVLKKMKLDEKLQSKTQDSSIKLEGIINSLIYYFLFIYVILLTLDILGVSGVLDPVKNMFNKLILTFPNIIAAVLIGVLGFIIAQVLASAIQVVTQGLNKYNKKVGLSENLNISKVLGQIVFIFVFVPILIAAMDTLKIDTISGPATAMLNKLMAAIPNILAAALTLAVFYVIGRFAANYIAELLKNLGADTIPKNIGAQEIFTKTFTFSKLCGGLILFFIMLGAATTAVQMLEMDQVSSILKGLLDFGGDITLGLIIFGVGNFIATLAYVSLKKSTESQAMPIIVRVAILGLVIAMGLKAMGIADKIVELAFSLTLGSIALVVALSFGLGGREAAGKQMEYWLKKLRK